MSKGFDRLKRPIGKNIKDKRYESRERMIYRLAVVNFILGLIILFFGKVYG